MTVRWPVILASASPRRQELLRRIISDFAVVPAHLDEDALTDPDPWVTAQRLAREKCLAVSESNPYSLVIGGDTVVAFEDGLVWRQLAKPADTKEAVSMLTVLQGRTHTVITGVALRWPGGLTTFTDASKVTFRPVPQQEIEAYVATGDPMDKAGSYGLQGGAKAFVERVEGSVDNVIGLPTEKLREALAWIVEGK